MIVIGLTGSIGMGKSTVAAMFRDAGVPVFDADAAVHRLYQPGGGAVGPVGALFAGVVAAGAVDRAALSAAVMGNQAALADLEAIVHPMVRAAEAEFLEQARTAGAALAVLEIPLLYETGAEARVDVVAVVSAPAEIQRARVLARPDMSDAKLAAILARQTDDGEKRRRADFVIDTGRDIADTAAEVAAIVAELTRRARQSEGGSDARDRA